MKKITQEMRDAAWVRIQRRINMTHAMVECYTAKRAVCLLCTHKPVNYL